jgi:iron-sulfur cluster repair protein YtfE (RIC family)
VNAIDLLKRDHEVVADLFEQVRNVPESKHSAIFTKIKAELDVHAHIEETVLYPRLKKDGTKKLADITSEGIEEHHQVKMFPKGTRRRPASQGYIPGKAESPDGGC